ncbi:hypothetical protein HDZ31DRAFT_69139 [Schizophyllum fasciatum]
MNNFNSGAYNYGYGLQNALAGTLSNPYATQQAAASSSTNPAYLQQGNYYSPHYANAYNTMNAQGFACNAPSSSFSHTYTTQAPQRQTLPAPNGSWYRPGSDRCRQPGCSFSGSSKSVEIHMMDRHLIYPPGYKKEKSGWDADPSLKGKKITILGTSVNLDDPKVLADWIAERKRRYPTADRVAEKKRQREEAAARGEIGFEVNVKRQRTDGGNARGADRGRGRRRGRGRGRGAIATPSVFHALPAKPSTLPPPQAPRSALQTKDSDASSSSAAEESDADAAPEEASSKVPAPERSPPAPTQEQEVSKSLPAPVHRRPAPQPRKPAPNPFDVSKRGSLLRKLLDKEVAVTTSNLSQAIRFIVDNDFFDGVELSPGEEQNRKIKVVEDTQMGA